MSYYLAQMLLKSGIGVQIVEQDYDKCIQLANMLPKATVIHGDATKEFLLDNEGISDCDALVTLTGVDEMNIIISLYGSADHNKARTAGEQHDIGCSSAGKYHQSKGAQL